MTCSAVAGHGRALDKGDHGAEGPRQGPRLWEVVVACAALLLYARTVTFGWAFDDQMEIVRNTFVHSLSHLPEILTTTVWTGSGMETYLYRPLVLVTYALNHAVSGLAPWSYHLVNVLLYAGGSVLVFRLGRLWRLPALAAGVGALLFVVHPAHVEVVANVAGRKDLLAAVCVLAMVITHRQAVRLGGGRLVIPAALYACAMMSKEVGAVGLFLAAVQDAFLEDDRREFFNRRRVMGLYFVYMGVLAAFLVVRMAVTGVVGVPETYVFDNPLVQVGTGVRLATALAVVGKGVALLAVPLTLSPDYSFDAIPVLRSYADTRLWGTAAGLGILAWAMISSSGIRRSVLPLAAAWYGLALLPSANVLVPVGTIFGERLLFLPSVAFCLTVGAGVAWLVIRYPRGAVLGGALLCLTLAAQTIRYAGAWTDDVTLFEWATESVPRSTKAHHKLGEEYLRVGRLGDALRALDQSLHIAPDNVFAADTRALARRAVADRYGGEEGGAELPADADVLYALGQAAREAGNPTRAVELWRAALAVDDGHAGSLADLGTTRLAEADTTAARGYLEQAVASDPALASAWFNLAVIRVARGERAAAGEALRRFLDTAGGRYPAQEAWAREQLTRMGAG